MIQQTMALGDGKLSTVIHLSIYMNGCERIACAAGLNILHAKAFKPWPYLRTNDWRAVKCEACKKTAIYQEQSRGQNP